MAKQTSVWNKEVNQGHDYFTVSVTRMLIPIRVGMMFYNTIILLFQHSTAQCCRSSFLTSMHSCLHFSLKNTDNFPTTTFCPEKQVCLHFSSKNNKKCKNAKKTSQKQPFAQENKFLLCKADVLLRDTNCRLEKQMFCSEKRICV